MRTDTTARAGSRLPRALVLAVLIALLLSGVGAADDLPQASSPPQITGTAQDGRTLTAVGAQWTSAVTNVRHQWQRCDVGGDDCDDLPGADGETYDLGAADVGTTLRVVERADNAGGTGSATSTATDIVEPQPALPQSTAAPQVAGEARSGSHLFADQGSWARNVWNVRFRWQRCGGGGGCADIAGATEFLYRLGAGDVGATVRVVVTVDGAGGTASAPSAATGEVDAAPPPPANVDPPQVQASAGYWPGSRLEEHGDSWDTTTWSPSWQWQRCDSGGGDCVDILGATHQQYELTEADSGATVRVTMTAEAAGEIGAASSDATAVVGSNDAAPVLVDPPDPPQYFGDEPREGSQLVGFSGSWTPPFGVDGHDQWQRCDASGDACQDVAGATDYTYVPTPDDVGHTMRMRHTVTTAGGTDSSVSAATPAIVAADAPAAVGPEVAVPTLFGSVEGERMWFWFDPWTPYPWGEHAGYDGLTYDYEWLRCDSQGASCAAIPGAPSEQSYELSAADVGATIRLQVTAHNAHGSDSVTTPASQPIVASEAPASTAAPSISSSFDGLSTDGGAWGDHAGAVELSYQWLRCDDAGGSCTDLAGATGSTLDTAGLDTGNSYRVRVTAQNAKGQDTATSDRSPTLGAQGASSDRPPEVEGNERVGSTLHAARGDWSGSVPLEYAYQWLRCDAGGDGCGEIDGATTDSYQLTGADADATIRARVEASNSVGSTAVTSDPTGAIFPAAPANTSPPSLAGSASEGATLTADPGTWQRADGGFGYEWQRCDAEGQSCAAIAGAPGSQHQLGAADVGATVRVVVTARGRGGSARVTSAASDVVTPT